MCVIRIFLQCKTTLGMISHCQPSSLVRAVWLQSQVSQSPAKIGETLGKHSTNHGV